MPRKKKNQSTEVVTQPSAESDTAVAEPASTAEAAATQPETHPVERPAWIDGPPDPLQDREGPRAEPSRNWGEPYKAIFTCPEMGFELGENRRFKQRVFMFSERPDDAILSELKENGFTYRAAEKAWTVPANAESRKLTDELARKWAGPNYVQGIER